MFELLLLSFLAAADPAVASPYDDSPEAELNYLMSPGITRQWERDSVLLCARSSSPAECRPAYLSARYSEVAMWVCRHVAGLEFRDMHGTTVTDYAQHSIRETCRSSIEYCRAAWRNYDAINFAGRPGQNDPRRLTHFEGVLTQNCGAAAGVDAPF